MRSLLLMRHGKSDWSADYDSDHDRPLNQRGVRSARLMGRVLSARNLVPDVAVSSTANRARSTVQLAMEAGQWGTSLELDESLYSSGVKGVMGVAREHLDADRLMLVGHQPTWSMLVSELTNDRADMRTGSVAVISVADDRLEAGEGQLVEVIVPRDYFGSSFDR